MAGFNVGKQADGLSMEYRIEFLCIRERLQSAEIRRHSLHDTEFGCYAMLRHTRETPQHQNRKEHNRCSKDGMPPGSDVRLRKRQRIRSDGLELPEK